MFVKIACKQTLHARRKTKGDVDGVTGFIDSLLAEAKAKFVKAEIAPRKGDNVYVLTRTSN